MKLGLWIPPRYDLTRPISPNDPGDMDVRVVDLFLEYLDNNNVPYIKDLDFRKAYIKNHQVFINDFCLSHLDHLVWFGVIDRSTESYHLEILRSLMFSTTVHNSYDFYNTATDKYSAFSILHRYGIPVSELYLVSSDNLQMLEPLFKQSSFLLKPRRSSFGFGIVKVDNYEHFRDIAQYHRQGHYYLEKFYPNDLADWTGVTVFNNQVLYGFRKQRSKISGWKVYDHDQTGGGADYVKPNEEIEAIALEIGRLLGANYFGLDFIKTHEGYKVVDINCYPGIYYEFIQDLKIPAAEYFFGMLNL